MLIFYRLPRSIFYYKPKQSSDIIPHQQFWFHIFSVTSEGKWSKVAHCCGFGFRSDSFSEERREIIFLYDGVFNHAVSHLIRSQSKRVPHSFLRFYLKRKLIFDAFISGQTHSHPKKKHVEVEINFLPIFRLWNPGRSTFFPFPFTPHTLSNFPH